ncbi:MAG TPA: ATP-binding cassette domain-containing protein [Nevskiaceae bacterium]
MAWSRAARPTALLVVLLAVPLATSDYFAYELGLYLLYGIAAQGVGLAWGRAGFLPLGQALFFGLGAYLTGFVLKGAAVHGSWVLVLLLVAVALPTALAYLIGRLVFARSHANGPDFPLITLALTMLGYQIANQWTSVTGGFNGLTGIPQLPGLDRYGVGFYDLVAVVCVLSTAGVAWLQRTPLGTLWSATAQNEDRLQFFGFPTDRLKSVAFAVSAFLAAVAGLLYAPQQGLVTPLSVGFELSAGFLIWAAVGGRASPYGALLGAVFIGLLSMELRNRFTYWEVVIALIFIVVVLRFPVGIIGGVERAWSWLFPGHGRLTATRPVAAPGSRLATTSVPRLAYEAVEVVKGGVRILDGLRMTVDQPGIHCIIGPNGAGKTSSFNVLTGRLPLTSGRIRLSGRDVSRARADVMARLGVGRKFQIPSVFGGLSVTDNIRIGLWANRIGGMDLLRGAPQAWSTPLLLRLQRAFPFLEDSQQRRAGTLSQGQRQMLEFAMTALAEPNLLLLDEPCAGLSPDETQHLSSVIADVVRSLGATALMIEHDMAAVEALADDVFVLHQGSLMAAGSYAEIRSNRDVQAIYAGGRK